jgi:hypothetical protein
LDEMRQIKNKFRPSKGPQREQNIVVDGLNSTMEKTMV